MKKALELFEKYINRTSKEERVRDFKSFVNKQESSGVTVDELCKHLHESYSNHLSVTSDPSESITVNVNDSDILNFECDQDNNSYREAS